MGTGNYAHSDALTVITEPFDSCEDEGDSSILFEDLLADMEEALVNTTFHLPDNAWRGRDGRIVARNGFYEIWVVDDAYGHVFVSYGLRGDIDRPQEALARAHLYRRANAFFDRLAELHPLRVATSAWTSAPRAISTELMAA
jgi:hypothetical protein